VEGTRLPRSSGSIAVSRASASSEEEVSAFDDERVPQEAADADSSTPTSRFAPGAKEEASFPTSVGRAGLDDVEADSGRCTRSSSAFATNDAAAVADEPSVPVLCAEEAELGERSDIMFSVDAASPAASGRDADGIMPKPTKELVLRVSKRIKAVAKSRGKQLSTAYGNFDQLVGQGWLIGDVVLGTLISFEDALAVGRAASRMAGGLEVEFATPVRRVGKRKFTTDEARVAALTEAKCEEAALRCAEVDLPLPHAPRTKKRKCAQPAALAPTLEAAPAPVPEPEPELDASELRWRKSRLASANQWLRYRRDDEQRVAGELAELEGELQYDRQVEGCSVSGRNMRTQARTQAR
jgi:hypothetical protein